MNIDQFIKVRFALEDRKHGAINSSDEIGICAIFENSVKKVSKINSPDASEYNDKSVEFTVGDVVTVDDSGMKYEVSNVSVEYHARGFDYNGQPSIMLRVYLKVH